MEWLDDSKACLDIAQIMLDEVEELIQESIQHDDVIPYLKVKIKNCLENCRSPLDYVANYIFDSYCRMEYTPNELKKFNVYYPIAHSHSSYKNYINGKYRSLDTKRPDIVNVMRNSQSFGKDDWLKFLPKLINTNKHRNLTKQERKETGVHIHNMTLQNGTFLQNVFSSGNGGADIVINGTPFNSQNSHNHSSIESYNAKFYVDFIFEDINKSVVPTLKDIHEGTTTVITELKKIM
ncbi:hypothetical protein [Bacillus luti]|uniref:hypothetical protein n=1 Tax=Bacillus luti TaxID=2026191 RepID=UPI0037755A3B